MKKIIQRLLLAALLVIGLSCRSHRDTGCGAPPRFSSTTLNFDARGGEDVITSSNSWYFESIAINDSCRHQFLCGQKGEEDCRLTIHCDSLHIPGDNPFVQDRLIEGAWFTIGVEYDEIWNPHKLLFSVQPNETGKSRKVQVFTGAPCAWIILTITQSAE